MAAVQSKTPYGPEPGGHRARCWLITLIYLIPIYWITTTAFKPRSLATTVPPTVLFEPEVTAFVKLFTKRVQMHRRSRSRGVQEGALVGAAHLRRRRTDHQGC